VKGAEALEARREAQEADFFCLAGLLVRKKRTGVEDAAVLFLRDLHMCRRA